MPFIVLFYQLSTNGNETSAGGTMKRLVIAALCIAGALPASPKEPAKDAWAALTSLLGGTWEGEGSGEPGNGTGGFTFLPDLQGKVLIRRNTSSYPATKDRPAFTHEDLMVISRDSASSPLR